MKSSKSCFCIYTAHQGQIDQLNSLADSEIHERTGCSDCEMGHFTPQNSYDIT